MKKLNKVEQYGLIATYIPSFIQDSCKEETKTIDRVSAVENEVKQTFKQNSALQQLQKANKREALAAYKTQLEQRLGCYIPINIVQDSCREVSHQSMRMYIH